METKNYFLGSVGRVEAFKMVNDKPVLAFVSKTLTDSGINTSVTADDIRAGQGAPIVTRFYHDPSVEITLTDVMFKRDYITAQLGAEFAEKDAEKCFAYHTETITASTTDGTLSGGKLILQEGTPQPLPGNGCMESTTAIAWYSKAGTSDWHIGEYNAGLLPEDGDAFVEGQKYCVRYLRPDLDAAVADIMADIIPEELHLIITVPLYAGDACAASAGKTAGEVQFDVPRFRLNGAQDFAAAMSSNQTMSLSGAAMATQTGCDTSAVLYTMRVVYKEGLELNFVKLIADAEKLNVGEVPVVYGIMPDNKIALIDNSELNFYQGETAPVSPATETDALNSSDEWVAGAAPKSRIILKSKPSLQLIVDVTNEG